MPARIVTGPGRKRQSRTLHAGSVILVGADPVTCRSGGCARREILTWLLVPGRWIVVSLYVYLRHVVPEPGLSRSGI